tara:strand:- start:982 stop:1791 length:810 start_codon:yes stop_codon:yes gene_type:complete
MDISIISLKQKNEIEIFKQMETLFPDHNIMMQPAVDLRKTSEDNLIDAGLICETGHTNLLEGRKWHWELNSKGGVGLAQANRLALLKNEQQDLLLFEDDCYIPKAKEKKFTEEIKILSSNTHDFDLAVFGAIQNPLLDKPKEKVRYMPDGWYYLNGKGFMMTHCTYYTKNGRHIVGEHLKNIPLGMQIDSLYSKLENRGKLRLIVQLNNWTAMQEFHKSSIQTDVCMMCNIHPRFEKYYIGNILIIFIGIIIITTIYRCCYRQILKSRF